VVTPRRIRVLDAALDVNTLHRIIQQKVQFLLTAR
jgi:hypothetical protein